MISIVQYKTPNLVEIIKVPVLGNSARPPTIGHKQ